MAIKMAGAQLTDEMVADMRARIGRTLRLDDSRNNEAVTRHAVLRFAEGIGDPNPLWTDPDYAAGTRYGALAVPPSWVYCTFGGIQFGWPGLGAFHSASDMTFERPLRLGDRVTPTMTYDGFDGPTESKFAGRKVTDHFTTDYRDQDGNLIASTHGEVVHFERASATQQTDRGKPLQLPHPWTEAELVEIEKRIVAEKPRGAEPRYWEDVQVGDELDEIIKGPVGLTDEVAFLASGAAPIPRLKAHRAALLQYETQPAWAFRDPHTFAKEPNYAVHYNDEAARAMGVNSAYDVGVQRHCWQMHLLTDWMGDDGWLQRSTMQLRGFVYLSDVVRLGGKVTGKHVDDDGEHVVTVDTWAVNQRGRDVMPGSGVIALPSREGAHPVDKRVSALR